MCFRLGHRGLIGLQCMFHGDHRISCGQVLDILLVAPIGIDPITLLMLKGDDLIEEVITPPMGNCTIVHRYATTTYATQVVLLATLTYMFQRDDWALAIDQAKDVEPLLLEQPLFRSNAGERIVEGRTGDKVKLTRASY